MRTIDVGALSQIDHLGAEVLQILLRQIVRHAPPLHELNDPSSPAASQSAQEAQASTIHPPRACPTTTNRRLRSRSRALLLASDPSSLRTSRLLG